MDEDDARLVSGNLYPQRETSLLGPFCARWRAMLRRWDKAIAGLRRLVRTKPAWNALRKLVVEYCKREQEDASVDG